MNRNVALFCAVLALISVACKKEGNREYIREPQGPLLVFTGAFTSDTEVIDIPELAQPATKSIYVYVKEAGSSESFELPEREARFSITAPDEIIISSGMAGGFDTWVVVLYPVLF